ncbi:MAG TPA: hypothetical protein VFU80_05475 [Sphingomicrobium sp.]|nr:hypothetical protein [Sphingomicrobium sp.]
MRTRLLVIAIAGLSFAGSVAAEPAKAPIRKADRPASQPVEVVVAAADQARIPAAADQARIPAAAEQAAPAPAKRERKARVTTCRCGDQTASN